MGRGDREEQWAKMTDKVIFCPPKEWQHAREIMEKRIKNNEVPPFKISQDKTNLNHSFLVALGTDNKPMLGVIARSKDQKEGILGFGSFGVCKLVLWEDGKKNAIKIVPDSLDQYEIEIMNKLGLIRAMFKRAWDKRTQDKLLRSNEEPNQKWLAGKNITDKLYMVMPLIDGVDLKQYLSSNDSKHTIAIQRLVAISLVNKLQAMHASNVIHNDLHTKNIMVDAFLNAYIIDQGKSIDLDNKPTTFDKVHPMFGREDTLAPELRAFKEDLKKAYKSDPVAAAEQEYHIPVSAASDVYSLGVVFQQIFYPVLGIEPIKDMVEDMTNIAPEDRMSLDEVLNVLKSPQLIEAIDKHDDWVANELNTQSSSDDSDIDPIVDNPDAMQDYENSFTPSPKSRKPPS